MNVPKADYAAVTSVGGKLQSVDAPDDLGPEVVKFPPFCKRCLPLIVHRYLRMKDDQPWRAAAVVLSMMLFQVVCADDEITKETGGDTQNLTIAMNARGCMACRYPRATRDAGRIIRLEGMEVAGAIARGKIRRSTWNPAQLALRKHL